MQELQQNVDEFQRESKVALEGPHMPSTAKLQQLIDQGQNLGVELSQCKPLKLVINWNCLDTQFFWVCLLDTLEFGFCVVKILNSHTCCSCITYHKTNVHKLVVAER